MIGSTRKKATAFFVTPRRYFCSVLVLSTVALATVLAIDWMGDGAACGLCLYQRVPYIVVMVLSSLAIVVCDIDESFDRFSMTLANICMLGFFVVAGLAGFHYLIAENWVSVSEHTRASLLNTDARMLAAAPDNVLAIWNAGIAFACGILSLMTLNRWEHVQRAY